MVWTADGSSLIAAGNGVSELNAGTGQPNSRLRRPNAQPNRALRLATGGGVACSSVNTRAMNSMRGTEAHSCKPRSSTSFSGGRHDHHSWRAVGYLSHSAVDAISWKPLTIPSAAAAGNLHARLFEPTAEKRALVVLE